MNPARYLVVGHPVAHSLSPDIHAQFAAQTGHAVEYGRQEVVPGGLAEFADGFRTSGGSGLNVTVPLKGEAFAYVDSHDALAAAAGAVNTIWFDNDQRRGFNTDGIGLVQDLTERHGVGIRGSNLLILGAGGAAQGVILPLLQYAPRQLIIANRTAGKADDLVQRFLTVHPQFLGVLSACALEDLAGQPPAHLVINATSAGLANATVALDRLSVRGSICYDMSYGSQAAFCRWASEAGAGRSLDGLGMLVEQAAEAFRIWRGVRPDTEVVLNELKQRTVGR